VEKKLYTMDQKHTEDDQDQSDTEMKEEEDPESDPIPYMISSLENSVAESEDLLSNTEAKKRSKRERKNVKSAPVKAPKERKKAKGKTPKTIVEDQRIIDLRNEFKLLTLKSAEVKGLSEAELKASIAKGAKMKEKDLLWELDKLRVQTSDSWTKKMATCFTEGYGVIADFALKTEGYIQREVREDENLQATVHGELDKVAFLMNPKARIAMLLFFDTFRGFNAKKAHDRQRVALPQNPSASIPPPPLLTRQNGSSPFAISSVLLSDLKRV
jgi:hypothetical protein